MENILAQYFERPDFCVVTPITTGLINVTYEVRLGINKYILQELNTNIFPDPEHIISNMLLINSFLKDKNYPKELLKITPNTNGQFLAYADGKTWRMTEFIPNSKGYNKVVSKKQAFNAAKSISEFHYFLNDFPIERISPSIKGFLDFNKRIEDYKKSINSASESRLYSTIELRNFIESNLYLIDQYLAINFSQRIVHADAKISNFLFDDNDENKVVALIDWDTILPGNILCDFGDMVRTYSTSVEEDDAITTNIFLAENYKAVKEGFLHHLKTVLTEEELNAIDLTAQVVILIQAIRFLTDYLNNDIYYSINYQDHNLDRTINQINLLKELNQYLCTN